MVWLESLRRALHGGLAPQRWFFRDDDAGWADGRLLALIDVFGAAGVHLDLAAIPAAVSPALGRRLASLAETGCVSVHQHGWTHVNHERGGRKCEFGPSRPRHLQERDIVRGREILSERLSGSVEPVFTPPWNRCTRETAELLAEHGFAALSADVGAPRRCVPALAETPVTVDWTRSHTRGGAAALSADLCDAVGRSAGGLNTPGIGVMLHHAVMDDEELVAVGDLLALLHTADQAAVSSIAALLDESGLTSVSPTGHGASAA